MVLNIILGKILSKHLVTIGTESSFTKLLTRTPHRHYVYLVSFQVDLGEMEETRLYSLLCDTVSLSCWGLFYFILFYWGLLERFFVVVVLFYYINEAGLVFTKVHQPLSPRVLELKVCTIIPGPHCFCVTKCKEN